MASQIQISFVIPVYNEELNIARVLKNLYEVLTANPDWNYEVIVIEDGSADRTKDVILKESKHYSDLQLVFHEKNKGYTQSLKDGIKKAKNIFGK